MNVTAETKKWAREVFGGCKLGDERRTARLVEYAGMQATNPKGATGRICKGDKAAMKGAYRLLENRDVDPDDIARGMFGHTATQIQRVVGRGGDVIVVEDTSTAGFKHDIAGELGNIGGPNSTTTRGFIMHAALAFRADGQELLGLVDQQRWIRPEKRAGRDARKRRAYEDKETVKWQRTSEHLRGLLGDAMRHVVSVCDREADVFEYLQNKNEYRERFVVRNCYDRSVREADADLKQRLRTVLEAAPVLGQRVVTVGQRGRVRGPKAQPARKGERVTTSVRSATVTLQVTRPSSYPARAPITMNAVWVHQADASKAAPRKGKRKPLDWLLLTTEPVTTLADAIRVIEIYEMRWHIEEHFKVLKTGCGLKDRRLQSAAGMERLLVILSGIAVRIQQLAVAANASPKASCDTILSRQH